MPAATYDRLKFLSFRDIVLWDVKRYASERIQSNYPIVKLGLHIQEQSQKEKLYDYPNEEFGILGVNNKIGIFDAYKEKGANINQAYKKMEVDWLAYNPYRINVGSIGMRTVAHQHQYISPAYVVFSCKGTLLPDFLFKLFKTERFNKIINESTTGSVRQNLTFDILKSLDIALPPVDVQKKFLDEYYRKIKKAEVAEQKINKLRADVEKYFLTELGITKQENQTSKRGITFTTYKSITRWAISYITNLKSFNLEKAKFPIVQINSLLSIFEGGKTPSTSNKLYWNGEICWTSPKDFNGFEIEDSEDKITELAVKDGMKVYPKGTILAVFRSGILRHSFPVAVTQMPTAINQDLKAMEVNPDIISKEYFLFYLHTLQKMVLELSSKIGVTVESINTDEFLSIPVILPALDIQAKIIRKVKLFQDELKSLQVEMDLNRQEAIKEFEQAVFKN